MEYKRHKRSVLRNVGLIWSPTHQAGLVRSPTHQLKCVALLACTLVPGNIHRKYKFFCISPSLSLSLSFSLSHDHTLSHILSFSFLFLLVSLTHTVCLTIGYYFPGKTIFPTVWSKFSSWQITFLQMDVLFKGTCWPRVGWGGWRHSVLFWALILSTVILSQGSVSMEDRLGLRIWCRNRVSGQHQICGPCYNHARAYLRIWIDLWINARKVLCSF